MSGQGTTGRTAAVDYYEVLGLARDADGSAVKRAYLTLIREHTPESAPERFRQISEAYRTLSNPEKRAEYDAQERLPPEVEAGLTEANRVGAEEPEQAIPILLRLWREHREYKVVRFTLGVMLDRADRKAEAARHFQELFDEEPDNANYAKWLGDALVACGQPEQGESYLKQSLVLDKDDPETYVCLARHYSGEGRFDEALKVLDRGIGADGGVDVQDLPLFLEKILVLGRSRDWTRMDTAVRRFVEAVPKDDQGARQYAAARFVDLARFFEEVEQPDLTKFAVDAALELDPTRDDLKEISQSLSETAGLFKERAAFMEDERVDDWAKAIVYALTMEEDEDKRNEVLTNVMQAIGGGTPAAFAHWQKLRRRYPALVDNLDDSFRQIRKIARENFGPSASSARSGGRGLLVWVVLGLVIALVRACL